MSNKHNRIHITPEIASSQYERDQEDRHAVETGLVKFYDLGRSFGFVTSQNAAKPDVFLPGPVSKRA